MSRPPEPFPLQLSRSSAAESVPRTGPTVPAAMLTPPTRWRSPSQRATRRHLLRLRRRRRRLRAPLGKRFSEQALWLPCSCMGSPCPRHGVGGPPGCPRLWRAGGVGVSHMSQVRSSEAGPALRLCGRRGRRARSMCPLGRCGARRVRHSSTTAADTGLLLRHRHSPPSSLATLWVDATRQRSLRRVDVSNFPTLGICICAFVLNTHRWPAPS